MPPHDDDHVSDDLGPPSVNLVAPLLGIAGIGTLVVLAATLGFGIDPPGDELTRCATIADGAARLHCFDRIAPPAPAGRALPPAGAPSREDHR